MYVSGRLFHPHKAHEGGGGNTFQFAVAADDDSVSAARADVFLTKLLQENV